MRRPVGHATSTGAKLGPHALNAPPRADPAAESATPPAPSILLVMTPVARLLTPLTVATFAACAAPSAPTDCPEPAPAQHTDASPGGPPGPTDTDTQDPASSPPGSLSPSCSSEAHRRFDFWIGDWQVENADGTHAGHNRIQQIHGGCALLEQWTSASGGGGTSTNYYDPGEGRWVQNWVDARGGVIELSGDLRDGSMVLEGRYAAPSGTTLKMRGTWTPLDDGRVRQFFETSPDGETWSPWFEGYYGRSRR